MSIPRVPYDPELRAALAWFKTELESEPLIPSTIESFRERFRTTNDPIEVSIGDLPVAWEDHVIPGPRGDIEITVLRPADPLPSAPGVYAIHGGGMILGSRFGDTENLIELVLEFGAVCVTVEYRLAPEHPHPAPLDDCYAGLLWMTEHARELGIDPERIILRGGSAGGGLAAACALRARDEGGPRVAGQMLICPMIDDRNDTVSARQYDGIGLWDRSYNRTGWDALLGDARGTDAVHPYAAPARATDLSDLPPAFIEVGAAEVFRDEDVAYATALWAAGTQAELHVWAGAFHGFSGVSPEVPVSRAAKAVRRSWVARIFGA